MPLSDQYEDSATVVRSRLSKLAPTARNREARDCLDEAREAADREQWCDCRDLIREAGRVYDALREMATTEGARRAAAKLNDEIGEVYDLPALAYLCGIAAGSEVAP